MVGKRVIAFMTLNLLVVSPVASKMRQRRDRSEHTGMTMSLAFSPDSSALLATRDHDLVLWDVETGRSLQTFVGHRSVVTSVAFSPNGKVAVSASNDGAIKLWSVASGREIRSLTPGLTGRVIYKKEVNTVAFTPDGKLLL